MSTFSQKSQNKLNSCDIHLVVFFNSIISLRDCTILCGVRSEEEQDEMFASGNSQLRYPHSKHNSIPSMAVDVAPYFANRAKGKQVSFNRYEVVEFGHYCLGVRDCLNFTDKISWGGDWDQDFLSLTDNEFLDAFHWEVV